MKTRLQTHTPQTVRCAPPRQSPTLTASLVAFALLATLQPRLGRSQTVDSFNPKANAWVGPLAVQTDGSVVLGGDFTTLSSQSVNYVGRVNSGGTLDTSFNPGANNYVLSLALQPDGKIVVGGTFTTLGALPFSGVGRLNTNGTADTTFANPVANNTVYCLALQPDGKIVVGGAFGTLAGKTIQGVGRLNTNGTLDTTFTNPDANAEVDAVGVQADGEILVAGTFTGLGGQTRDYIGRLNTNGTLDTTFNPLPNARVRALGLQADGLILVGGDFTTLGGQTYNLIGRLNTDGTVDTNFNLGGANSSVYSFAIQPDGNIVVGGAFTALGGPTRDYIGRLLNTEPASQSLSFDGSTITWQRGGSSPEVWWTSFDFSTNSISWTSLGVGTRITGGWQLTNVSIPYSLGTIRARGYVAMPGSTVTSSYFVETDFQLGTPLLSIQKAVYVESPYLLVGSNYQLQVSTDLNTWTNSGPAFTATNATWRTTNYWDVDNWNQLFFRLQFAP